MFINGLANFENFVNSILNNINPRVVVVNTREPLDYDSVFFYPILGTILGVSTVYLFKILYSLSYQAITAVFIGSIIYVAFVVILLILTKPISSRYGK